MYSKYSQRLESVEAVGFHTKTSLKSGTNEKERMLSLSY